MKEKLLVDKPRRQEMDNPYYSVEVRSEKVPHTLKAIEMRDGQIGRIRNALLTAYEGELVMRMYRGLMSLTHPTTFWSIDGSLDPNFDVQLLAPGTEIILKVRG
jgi:hypothetical protein